MRLVRAFIVIISAMCVLANLVSNSELSYSDPNPSFRRAVISVENNKRVKSIERFVSSIKDIAYPQKKLSSYAIRVTPALNVNRVLPRKLTKLSNPCQDKVVKRVLKRCPTCSCSTDFEVKASVTPVDAWYPNQWGLNNTQNTDINAPEAWDMSTGSSTVVIGVIDTGIKYDHGDLYQNMWVNPGETSGNGIDDDTDGVIDDIYGLNAITDTGNPYDDNGHGTHVAGIIGAKANNTIGVSGINWNVKMIACKFLNSAGSGATSDAIQCIDYLTNLKTVNGINVIATNNSWGGGGISAALSAAIGRANTAGILFIVAAGNSGANIDYSSYYPPSYNLSNMITVGSTTITGELSSFSNYGTTLVHIAAPGSNIISTWLTGGYASLSGTSMAAPFVTGVAALLKASKPALTAAQIKSAIISGASTRSGLTGFTANGGILLDASGALVAGSVSTPTPTYTPIPTSTGTYTQTPTPTATRTFTSTPTQTATSTATSTVNPSFTETPTPTRTFTPTITPLTNPTATQTPTRTPTPTATSTPTNTATPTITPLAAVEIYPGYNIVPGGHIYFRNRGIGTLTISLQGVQCGTAAVRNNIVRVTLPPNTSKLIKKVDASLTVGSNVYNATFATVFNRSTRTSLTISQSCARLMSSIVQF